MTPLVRVVAAAESAARDAAAIAAGTPSRALMQRAGAAAAAEIARRFRHRLDAGVLVFAGPGNNGGDAWVVARALAAAGISVRVVEPVEPKTDDARAERALALQVLSSDAGDAPHRGERDARREWDARSEPHRGERDATRQWDARSEPHRGERDARREWDARSEPHRGERIIIDGVLGTGAAGAPRGAIAAAIDAIAAARARGASVAALDLPSGLDATSGEATHAVVADLTVTFGTLKRGHLVARGRCGAIVVVDIGLGLHAELDDGAPCLVDARWARAMLPPIGAEAHKGTRRRLAIVGGAGGMAGATILAARAAMRSGIGMTKLVVAPESLEAVQRGEPAALATAWPADDAALRRDVLGWADALVVGPGLGRSTEAAALLERVLAGWTGPLLLDADALNLFAGRLTSVRELRGGAPTLLTPHPAELGRLLGVSVDDVLARRFEIGAEAARASGCAVLLKGTPTVVTAAGGARLVSAAGTPALATAGSGDVLSGVAGTLLAQMDDPAAAGALGAWAHGRAAELASLDVRRYARPGQGGASRQAGDDWSEELDEPLGPGDAPLREARGRGARRGRRRSSERLAARGVTLDDVIAALADVWRFHDRLPRYPVLAELPAVGDAEP